ncbi:hypothetical protein ACH6EH_01910 [Paenibacillus sp. JSM ZJ436]|uniref:hypothetical protein n=1 Tax=Paenibacillus sp. JSM ZJ436 TaxID=3376190 RepID=UPI0037A9E708
MFIQGLKRWVKVGVMTFLTVAFIGSTAGEGKASASAWDAALRSVEGLYDGYESAELSLKVLKGEVSYIRKQNNERLDQVNAAVKQIDKSKLNQLQAAYEKLKEKHDPLLKQYTELGKKAAAARKAKDSKGALVYDLKRNQIKEQAAAARLEIKKKYDELDAAKKQTAAKAKLVKDALQPVYANKTRITAENKTIAEMNKRKSAADQRYKSSVKLGDAIGAAIELNRLLSELRGMYQSHQHIYQWEKDIKQQIFLAEAKLPR